MLEARRSPLIRTNHPDTVPGTHINVKIRVGDYKGGLRSGMAHGSGVFVFNDGSVYRGDFKDGMFHGWGQLNWKDGTPFSGALRDRDSSFYNWDNGKYIGNFEYGKFSDFGKMTWCDGSRFRGFFKDGVVHGDGNWTKGDDWAFANDMT